MRVVLLRLLVGCLVVLALSCGAFVVWHEMQFRERFHTPRSVDVPAPPAPTRETLDATAVATVLGLAPQATLHASAERLTLQASFVTRSGLSKALLADAQGPKLYRVGDRLPGGSVLRRVQPDHVVLWHKGREERLMLQPPAQRFLHKLEPAAAPAAPVASTRYLRPVSGLPE